MANPIDDDLTREEFCKRFVTRMIDTAGVDRFDNGELILDYAEETAPTYWETDGQQGMDPEDCADADMSYWGE